jgi:hypothetical protein
VAEVLGLKGVLRELVDLEEEQQVLLRLVFLEETVLLTQAVAEEAEKVSLDLQEMEDQVKLFYVFQPLITQELHLVPHQFQRQEVIQ